MKQYLPQVIAIALASFFLASLIAPAEVVVRTVASLLFFGLVFHITSMWGEVIYDFVNGDHNGGAEAAETATSAEGSTSNDPKEVDQPSA